MQHVVLEVRWLFYFAHFKYLLRFDIISSKLGKEIIECYLSNSLMGSSSSILRKKYHSNQNNFDMEGIRKGIISY